MTPGQAKQRPAGGTIHLILFCTGGIALFAAVAILPRYRALQKADSQIQDLQARLQEQTLLQPVYAEAKKQLKTLRPNEPVLPQRERMKADKMPDLTALFSRLAAASGMELVYAIPDAKSLEEGYKRILVKLLAQGPVARQRDFLLAVVELPWVDHLDQIDIQRGEGTEELRLQLWLAIE